MQKIPSIKRVRISKVGRAVLGTLIGVGIITTFAVLPGLTVVVAPFLKQKKPRIERTIHKSLESLIKAGLIERQTSKGGAECIRLTTRGRFEAMLTQGTLSAKKQKWDGEWRIVMFDVPNTKTKLRNELRRSMRLFGFKLIQKSVWVYPYSCDDFISLLKSHLGISHDVLYMKVSYIENDKHLKREFGLTSFL